MPKCFFYLRGAADSWEGSFGLRYFEAAESAADYARTIAQELRPDVRCRGFSIVATDQGGTEIARVAVAQSTVRVPRQHRIGRNSAADSLPRKSGTHGI